MIGNVHVSAAAILATVSLSTLGSQVAALEVEYAWIESRAHGDPGTVHVYVRNTDAAPIEIASMTVELPEGSCEAERVVKALLSEDDHDDDNDSPWLWWRSWPKRLEPGGYADVSAKLAEPPTEPFSVRIETADGRSVERVLDRINDALELSAVSFSESLDTAYVYFENRTDQAVRLRSVQVNGTDVTQRVKNLWPALKPKGLGCLVVPLPEDTRPGTFLFIRMETDPPGCGVALVRAFHGFPVTWLDGSIPEGVARAGVTPRRSGHVPNEGLAGYENIMRCPAHAHGTPREAAATFIRLHEQLLAKEPHVPGMIYVCRWGKEHNYFIFSELADVTRVMPFADSENFFPQPREHRMQWVTALALRGAAPRPVHAVVPIRFADSFAWTRSCTPQEIRALIYLPLSRGARGLCLGRKTRGLSKEATAMLTRTIAEVDSIRDVLAMAAYVPLGHTNHPQTEAATLLAGDRAMIVLLINHSFEDFDDLRPLVCTPVRDVESRIELPPGLKVAEVRDVADPTRQVAWQQDGDILLLQTEEVEIVQPYRVTFDELSTIGSHMTEIR